MNGRYLLIPVIITLSITLFGGYWVHFISHHVLQDKVTHAQQIAFDKARTIELELMQSLSATQVLSLFVTQQQGKINEFEVYADSLIKSHPLVDNVQLAPAGVVSYIFPLQGHESAIGHNLLNDPKRKVDAERAISSRKLTLSGPFELKQGGTGLIGRLPIFLNESGENTFWGFASALIYFNRVLDEAGLSSSANSPFLFSLSAIDSHTGQLTAIIGQDPTAMQSEAKAISLINLPNQQWQLCIVIPPSTLEKVAPKVSYMIVLLVGLCSGLISWKYLQLPAKLHLAVKKKTEQLETLSFTDSVTGIANRRFFMKSLLSPQQQPKNSADKALLFIDLDDFKVINDRYGHQFGDSVLRIVAKRIKESAASCDVTARIGGDEFGQFIFGEGEQTAIHNRVERLISSLKKPMIIEDTEVCVSASVGVALTPQHGRRATELLKAADIAMYHAKQLTCELKYCIYQPFMAQSFQRLPEFKRDFKQALLNNQLRLYYQPIYCLKSQYVAHYEALVRWQHPAKGLLAPSEFLELAEQVNLLKELEYWVLNRACSDIAHHKKNHNQDVSVAINMSPMFLTDSDLLHNIDACLTHHKLQSDSIKLELTESSVLSNHDVALSTLSSLKDKGVEVALDDFGTGYSSFSLLHELPLRTLKLDKSFIDKLLVDNKDYCVVESVIGLAHKLNLNVIAEGIESKEQEDKLNSLGCDFGQGYYFSRPQPQFNDENHASRCGTQDKCKRPCLSGYLDDDIIRPITAACTYHKPSHS